MLKALNLVCLIIAFISFVLNLTANCSSYWWVALKPHEFERVGLWEICFNHYRHRFDYYGKIYTGCWWHFSPETYSRLFSWVSTPWYQAVQGFATCSMLVGLGAVGMIAMLATSPAGKVSSRFILTTATVTLTSAVFMLIAVMTFGMRGKDRNWMPRFQQNWFGWSFVVAIISCILEFVAGLILLFDGLNMKLVKKHVEKLYLLKQKRFPSAPRPNMV